MLHHEGNVPIVENQQEMTPLQRRFLMYGRKHHLDTDTNNTSDVNVPSELQ